MDTYQPSDPLDMEAVWRSWMAGGLPVDPTRPQVVVPYIPDKLREETVIAVRDQWAASALVQLLPDDETGYASLLADLWRLQRDLVVVEQDVVPPPGGIALLLECPERWCTYPYWTGHQWEHKGFGLVKFSARLQVEHPQLMDRAVRHHGGRGRLVHWGHVDTAFAREAGRLAIPVHSHNGTALHLHDYEAEGQGATNGPR